jgi:hypothetical protein
MPNRVRYDASRARNPGCAGVLLPALPATDPLAFFNRKTWAGMTPSMMNPDAAR